ncbi:MAG: hypothetical protein ABMA64_30250 [Myxococcota bacterium]
MFAGLVAPLVAAGGRGRSRPAAAPTEQVEAQRLREELFPASLPLDPGAVPAGLFGSSAQVCASCHPTAAATWAASAHAAPPSEALLGAAEGLPACLGCHLPLGSQSEWTYTWDGGRIDRPLAAPNAGFDATLSIEGVTCAACHLRGGAVVAATEAEAAQPAPHPMVWSTDLGGSVGCAACHQLTWPGAEEPLYDTWGEWKRAGFDRLGLTCQGCHLGASADGGPVDHTMRADPARAVTIELSLPSTRLTRGAAPAGASVSLTNTGAGHAFPTGSPFRGVRLTATLEPAGGGDPVNVLQVDLERALQPTPPFALLGDSRLAVGETRRWDLPVAAPPGAPPGRWALRLTLRRTTRGEVHGEPFVDRRWPLVVE